MMRAWEAPSARAPEHVLLRPHAERRAAHDPGVLDPAHEAEHQHDVEQPFAGRGQDRDGQQHARAATAECPPAASPATRPSRRSSRPPGRAPARSAPPTSTDATPDEQAGLGADHDPASRSRPFRSVPSGKPAFAPSIQNGGSRLRPRSCPGRVRRPDQRQRGHQHGQQHQRAADEDASIRRPAALRALRSTRRRPERRRSPACAPELVPLGAHAAGPRA